MPLHNVYYRNIVRLDIIERVSAIGRFIRLLLLLFAAFEDDERFPLFVLIGLNI